MVAVAFVFWIPVTVLLFATLRPAKAATLAYVCGWLLLPATKIPFEGFWDIDKTLVVAVGVMAGVGLCCRNPLKGLRPSRGDVLLIAFAITTGLSSVANALGTYDGVCVFINTLIYYGVAFGAGRVFLRERRDLVDAAQVVCCGAALYAILALWEWRMSPQIHSFLYEGFQHNFGQHKRWGLYRPVVCFSHALSLGMFFAGTSLLAIWMHMHRLLRPLGGIPASAVVAMSLVGLVCSMSMGPLALFSVGFGLLWMWKQTRLRGWVAVPFVFAVLWMGARYSGVSTGEWLVSISETISSERSVSLQYRIDAETLLLDHAQERPWFGWGGWARNIVFRASGRNAFASDAFWVILVGQHGLLGVAAFYLWWAWPLLLGLRRSLRPDPVLMVLLVLIGMEMLNTLFNGVVSPLTIFLAGGATSVLLATGAPRVAPASVWGGGAWTGGVRSSFS